MNNLMKKLKISFLLLCVTASLAACGNDSTSGPTTVPNSATVFYAHNLVFRNNTTLATGYNGFGQLGVGDLSNRTTPVAVSGGIGFSGFATGGNHSVAFFNSSTVRSWGYNGFGQLGNRSTTYSSTPVSVFRTFSTSTGKTNVNLSGVTAVAAGSTHTLARKNDGTVWAWGENTTGQLGVSLTSPSLGYSTDAVQVGGGVPLTNIIAIAANGDHSLALDSFGQVWAWGYNGTGQLGLDPKDTGARAVPSVVPKFSILAEVPVKIVAIAAGGAFNYALTEAGTVWAWGNNANGQLGNGTTVNSFIPVQMLKTGGTPLTNVTRISAGLQHGLAMDSNDNVWALGYNIYGQLGNNGQLDSSVAVQVSDPSGVGFFTGASDIRAFGSSSMARNASGWYVWGNNGYGQLGTGGGVTSLLPVKLPGF